MTGKRAAREQALSGALSIGDLRGMIKSARGRGGQSNVNPAIELERALDIYDAALNGRDDTEIPAAWRTDPYSRSGRQKPTRDVLIMTNIIRDAS